MQRVVFIFIMASHPASLHLYSLEFWYLGDSVVVWLFFQTPQLVAAGIVVGGSMRKEKIVGLKKSSFLVRMTPCKHGHRLLSSSMRPSICISRLSSLMPCIWKTDRNIAKQPMQSHYLALYLEPLPTFFIGNYTCIQ